MVDISQQAGVKFSEVSSALVATVSDITDPKEQCVSGFINQKRVRNIFLYNITNFKDELLSADVFFLRRFSARLGRAHREHLT